MTTTAIRKKVHQYIDEAEENVLEVVYKVLKLHSGEESILSDAQKQELDKTLAEHKAGKLKYYSLEQAQSAVYGKAKK
ncbi:MAG: addiction module protein [Bacteroidetes bacterium]|nr:addiction module protein [Bacteroidota bacterium]